MPSMPDGNTAALNQYEEEQRDMERDVEALKGRALDDLVWKTMNYIEGRPFDLADFLYDTAGDTADEVCVLLRGACTVSGFEQVIESRLRSHLEGSEAVERRAEEMASEE